MTEPISIVGHVERCAVAGAPAGSDLACGDCDPCTDPRCWTKETKSEVGRRIRERQIDEVLAEVRAEVLGQGDFKTEFRAIGELIGQDLEALEAVEPGYKRAVFLSWAAILVRYAMGER